MISFYPGPSRVHDAIPAYVRDAHKLGMLSINHRSNTFMDMCERTNRLLKQKLRIPKDYMVFFTSSATECWEIIAQSLPGGTSYHLYNGAFGQKWYEYTGRIRQHTAPLPFQMEAVLDPQRLLFEQTEGTICMTHNETSNGTQVASKVIRAIKERNPSYLIAVDATSSMAGVLLDYKAADIWLASVQKCFGLPAGLGILVCSPMALQRARQVDERQHYNSLPFMMEMMEKWQTPFTPNVLGIYLLMRVLENMPPARDVHAQTMARYERWKRFIGERKTLQHLVANENAHSHTVLPVRADEDVMKAVKKAAKRAGILLGEGYGAYKTSTFRIANFPAIKDGEIRALMKVLQPF